MRKLREVSLFLEGGGTYYMPSMVQQKWLRHLPPAPTKTKPNYVADTFAFPSAIRWVPHPTTLGFQPM
jgi:hypothetical protein